MKKISIILCLSLIAGLTASAQMDLVKDVESTIKGNSANYLGARSKLALALTNPESKDNSQTWYVAGKIEYGLYDDLYKKQTIGQEVDGKEMGNAIINGYKYMMTALPLDAVTDAKGKVKAKYTKDIIKTIVEHYYDYDRAAVLLWGVEDYSAAYEAWEIYLNLPNEKALGKDVPNADPDSIVCVTLFNQGLAAWQASELEKALDAFKRAEAKGYEKKQLYDYSIAIASRLGDNEEVQRLAATALPLYGNEDPTYIQLLINNRIENKDYDTAYKMLSDAIIDDPNNAYQYYNSMGILYDIQEDKAKAKECYQKSIELNPEWSQSLCNLGRITCEEAYNIKDNLPNMQIAQYEKINNEQIVPLFKEAAQYLEKAYSLDEANMDEALRYLKDIYYNLNDEENYNRVDKALN